MSGAQQVTFMNQRSFITPPGQEAFTTAGTFTWVAPAGVTRVSVVAVGGGAVGIGYSNGGGGGGLGYKNNITVVPADSYTVVVGVGGTWPATPTAGGQSYFNTDATVKGGGGSTAGCGGGGTFTGDGGGNGGGAYRQCCCTKPSSGGAGGYSGNGGTASAGSGGGGAGGCPSTTSDCSTNGGGVGILGQGANGAFPSGAGSGGSGTLYGGGHTYVAAAGAGRGAVRIIWPGCARSFPSTRTADE